MESGQSTSTIRIPAVLLSVLLVTAVVPATVAAAGGIGPAQVEYTSDDPREPTGHGTQDDLLDRAHPASFVPGSADATDAPFDVTLEIGHDSSIDEDPALQDPVYDRIVIEKDPEIEPDIPNITDPRVDDTEELEIRVGGQTFTPSVPWQEGDCSVDQDPSNILTWGGFFASDGSFTVCETDSSFHITLSEPVATRTVTVTFDIDPPTTADIYDLNLTLLETGQGLDHVLDIPYHDLTTQTGEEACDPLPQQVRQVLDDTSDACEFAVVTAQQVPFEVTPAAPDHLAFADQPSSPVTAGATWDSFDVRVEDRFGNLVTDADTVVTLEGNASATGALENATETAEDGTATFDEVRYTVAETFRVNATNASLTTATSDPVEVVPAGLEEVQLACPDKVIVDETFSCTADPVDAFGNDVPVDLNWSAEDAEGSDIPTDSTSEQDGTFTATFTAPASVEVGPLTVNATAEDPDGNEVEESVDVELFAPATHLAFVDPTSTMTAGDPVELTIQRQDENGNPVTDEEAVVVSLSTTSADGRFLDADGNVITTVTIPEGTSQATVRYNDTDAGEPTLTADNDSLSAAHHTITVEPARLTEIQISCSPTEVEAGDTSDCTATPLDEFGNERDDQPTWQAPDGGLFDPDTGQTTTFHPPTDAGTYRVYAEHDGVTSNVVSIDVVPDDVHRYEFVDNPFGEGTEVSADAPQAPVRVQAFDAHNNPIPGHTVHLEITEGQGGSLSDTAPVTDANGEVEVTLSTTTDAGEEYRIRALDDPQDPTVTRRSGLWTVVPGDLDEIRILDAADGTGDEIPDQTLTAGDTLDLFAAGFDAHGNFIDDVEVEWSQTADLGTFDDNPAPSVIFQATTTGEGRIVATHADTSLSNDTGLLTVEPGPLDHVVVEDAGDGSGEWIGDHEMTADESLTLYAICHDEFENPIGPCRVDWNINWLEGQDDDVSAPSDAKFFEFDPDDAPLELEITVDNPDLDGAVDNRTGTIDVVPGVLDSFRFTTDAAENPCEEPQTSPVTTTTAGDGFDLFVTACDAHENVKVDYTGEPTFDTTDPDGQVPGSDTGFTSEDDGQREFSFVLFRSEPDRDRTETLNVTDDACCGKGDTLVTVLPRDLDRYRIDPPKFDDAGEHMEVPIGQNFTTTVEAIALDEFDNPLLAGHTVHWTLLRGSNNAQQDTGSLSDTQTETNADGVATVDFTASEDIGDIFRVRADNQSDPNANIHNVSAKFLVVRGVQDGESIQAAVDAADEDELILVEPGTYNEAVTVDKNLTLEGAQAGVDARTRTDADESIVGTASGGFVLTADNVTLDGFTVRGVTDCLQGGISTSSSASGYTIVNNVIRDNELGIKLRADGEDETVVRHNRLADNDRAWYDGTCDGVAKAVSTGFDSGDVLHNATIDANRFVGHTEGDDSYAIQLVANQGGHGNVTVSDNDLTGDSSVVLGDLRDSELSGNEIDMDDDDSSTAVFVAGNVSDVTISDNLVNGTERGIWFAPDLFGVSTESSGVEIVGNDIVDNPTAGVLVADGRYTGDLEIHQNSIVGNEIGVNNTDTSGLVVNATENWWGAGNGPSGGVNDPLTGALANGSGDEVSDNVRFDPWLTSEP